MNVVGKSIQTRSKRLTADATLQLQEYTRQYLAPFRAQEPIEMDLRPFLSYAHEDYDEVRLFYLQLLRMGLPSFLDQSEANGIHIGEDWIRKIFEMLSKCCCMIVFMSPHYLESEFAGYELSFFTERVSMTNNTFLAFVMLQRMEIGETLKKQGASVIDWYRMSVVDAAELLIHGLGEFYRGDGED